MANVVFYLQKGEKVHSPPMSGGSFIIGNVGLLRLGEMLLSNVWRNGCNFLNYYDYPFEQGTKNRIIRK